MESSSSQYDPRYLEGVALFNRGDYFEAHDIWEELWRDCPADDRRFYQGLIQAAVAIYHWCNGNARGSRRLFHSGRSYMLPYPVPYHGLDVTEFWRAVERFLAPALSDGPAEPGPVPHIHIDMHPGGA
jgi:predicted metal-dependent hydrolase